MLDKKLKEALELLGGKAIIKDGEQIYILMTLQEFRKTKQEGISGLTKQELVDKINNDIAAWKSAQTEEEVDKINLDELSDSPEENEVQYEKTNLTM